MDDQTVDGDAVDDSARGLELAPIEPAANIAQRHAAGAYLAGQTPQDILSHAGTIATALKDLIETQRMSVSVGGTRKHVEVSGWQVAGAMLGALGGQPLHAETVWTRPAVDQNGDTIRHTYTATVRKGQGDRAQTITTYDVDGHDWEACVEVRTADGAVVGKAEAMCSRAEATWARREDFALRSMAETRAESRAFRRAIGWIMHMAGYSPTPAEEMGATPVAAPEPQPASLPDWAQPVTVEEAAKLQRALTVALDGTGVTPSRVLDGLIRDTGGGDGDLLPWIAYRAVRAVAAAAQAAREAPSGAQEPPEPVSATDEPSSTPPEASDGPDIAGWPDLSLRELIGNADASDDLRQRAADELERRHPQADTPTPTLLDDDDNPDLHTL
jgi:hypothetical protein